MLEVDDYIQEVDDSIQEVDDYTWKTNDTHATRNMCERRMIQ
jgi:hypothetical protein